MTADAVVLAGGASARFGSDKLAADLHGRPLLHHALDAVAAVADRIVVVVGPEAAEADLPPSLAGRIVVVRDAVAHRGPLAGLAAGLEGATANLCLVVGGDMPRLVPAVLRVLLDRLEGDPLLAAARLEAEPPPPLPMAVRPGLVSSAVRSLLAEDRRSLRSLLERVPCAVVPAIEWRFLDAEGRSLVDVDVPADLGPG